VLAAVRKVWISLAESYPYRRQFEQVYTNLRRILDRLALRMGWSRCSDVDAAAKGSCPDSTLKVRRNPEKIAVRFSAWKVLCQKIDERGALPRRCHSPSRDHRHPMAAQPTGPAASPAPPTML